MSEYKLVLPIVSEDVKQVPRKKGAGTAGVVKKIKDNTISSVKLNEDSLASVLEHINELSRFLKKSEGEHVSTDSISFKLGVTNSGMVGIMGNGFDLRVRSELSLTFKLK